MVHQCFDDLTAFDLGFIVRFDKIPQKHIQKLWLAFRNCSVLLVKGIQELCAGAAVIEREYDRDKKTT